MPLTRTRMLFPSRTNTCTDTLTHVAHMHMLTFSPSLMHTYTRQSIHEHTHTRTHAHTDRSPHTFISSVAVFLVYIQRTTHPKVNAKTLFFRPPFYRRVRCTCRRLACSAARINMHVLGKSKKKEHLKSNIPLKSHLRRIHREYTHECKQKYVYRLAPMWRKAAQGIQKAPCRGSRRL